MRAGDFVRLCAHGAWSGLTGQNVTSARDPQGLRDDEIEAGKGRTESTTEEQTEVRDDGRAAQSAASQEGPTGDREPPASTTPTPCRHSTNALFRPCRRCALRLVPRSRAGGANPTIRRLTASPVQVLGAGRAVLAGRVPSGVEALVFEAAHRARLADPAAAALDAAAPELARRARAARRAHFVPLEAHACVVGLVCTRVAARALAHTAAPACGAPLPRRTTAANNALVAPQLCAVLLLVRAAWARNARRVARAVVGPVLTRGADRAGCKWASGGREDCVIRAKLSGAMVSRRAIA